MSKNVLDLDVYKSEEELKREILSLKRENQAAHKTIDKLLKDNSNKNEEIKHLQSLVGQMVPVIQPAVDNRKKIQVDITPEEEIAMMQIDRLRKLAQTRSLTLEETKIFDLLVKNKRLSQDESTINLAKGQWRSVEDVDLLQIASRPDDSDKSDQ